MAQVAEILVNYEDSSDIFTCHDVRALTLRDLETRVESRFLKSFNDMVKNSSFRLCDRQNSSEPLNEERFRKMIDSISNLKTRGNVTLVDKQLTNKIELWFCNPGKYVLIL